MSTNINLPTTTSTTTTATTTTITISTHRDPVNLYVSAMSYNILTLTDGAIRMIVLLFFVQLNFTALAVSIMFSLYELMGVFTNLFGGLIGSWYGMRFLLLASCGLQCLCVTMLCLTQVAFPDLYDKNLSQQRIVQITAYLTVGLGLSGASKDFMKIQGKSVPKFCTKPGDDDKLFKIVSWLTGMKNSLKGAGYFLGSLLVWGLGWIGGLVFNAGLVVLVIPPALMWMENDLGLGKKDKVSLDVFKKGWNVNILSFARVFLFGSRDVWFEVAIPYFFRQVLFWAPFSVGAFFATYTIIYGQLQAVTTQLFNPSKKSKPHTTNSKKSCCNTNNNNNNTAECCGECGYGRTPNRKDVPVWASLASVEVLILGIVNFFAYQNFLTTGNANAVTSVLCLGIALFAVIFAVNSAVHSYLIVLYSDKDKVSIDVGFYYMSNAFGRLFGTLTGGFIYTYTVAEFGMSVCLWVAAAFLMISTGIAVFLREHKSLTTTTIQQQQQQTNLNTAVGTEGTAAAAVVIIVGDNSTTTTNNDHQELHSTEIPMMSSSNNNNNISMINLNSNNNDDPYDGNNNNGSIQLV
jgi:MFS family permease